MRYHTALTIILMLFSLGSHADTLPYQNNPEIIKTLNTIQNQSSIILSPVNVNHGRIDFHEIPRFGPGQRDYCNKMPYATDRQTALYAGGNHQSPHRMNDVWEYHLGSNTWHLIYEPDGGNAGKHKGAYFLTSRTLVKNPNQQLNEKQKQQIEAYRIWWKKHVHLKDGHITTNNGGPIMPVHTWDSFTYDPNTKQLLWPVGANPAAQPTTHAYFTNQPVKKVLAQLNPDYTPMWMFNTQTKKWQHHKSAHPHPDMRGMGASMLYLPDKKKSLWYVAAQNVSPHDFDMQLYDATTNQWTKLKPNNNTPIRKLALELNIAPTAEQQMAYSPKHQKIVAVKNHDTFVYDFKTNNWSKVNTNPDIYAHDAHSVFAYDTHADVFILAHPTKQYEKQLKLAVFSLKTNQWQHITPRGPAIPTVKYGMYMGYYDPTHNVFMLQPRYSDKIWLYRHKQ